MRIVFKEIFEGWKNHLIPTEEMKKHIAPIVEKRKAECDQCPLNIGNICSPLKQGQAVQDFSYHGENRIKDFWYSGCACPLTMKQKSLQSICPLGKWLEELSPEENLKLQDI